MPSTEFIRPLTRAVVLVALAAAALVAQPARAFGFDDVAREAERLARLPYRKPPEADPALARMSYDAYRKQRFRQDQATWRGTGLPFELQYFALGRGFSRALTLHEIVGNEVRPLRVTAAMFENGAAAGAAGFRIHRGMEGGRRGDEIGAFLGASYFRMVAPGLRYGISARGLAVDTIGGRGEEFPEFTTWWMQRPAPGDTELKLFALLESARVTGAYAFVIKPLAASTTVEVRARLILREPVARLGIAPLTSMFLAGETQPVADDYRPEVHDSDGLQIATGAGEWLWRPLTNPPGVFATGFSMASLRGFGLMQRDRQFTSYHDLEARYELRPSAWVEPIGDWGPGRVELLQFNTPNETHDNIGAWWFPDRMPAVGEPVEFAWRVNVTDRQPLPPAAWVAQTRVGHGYREAPIPPANMQYHVDFAGAVLDGLKEDEVEAVVSGNANVRKLRAIAHPNEVTKGWRVTIDYERIDPKQPVELRAFLRSGTRTLSETWSHATAPQ